MVLRLVNRVHWEAISQNMVPGAASPVQKTLQLWKEEPWTLLLVEVIWALDIDISSNVVGSVHGGAEYFQQSNMSTVGQEYK